MHWDTDLLSNKIAEHIERLEIDTILTFDSYGVSGHQNHVSIYLALFHLAYSKALPDCEYEFNVPTFCARLTVNNLDCRLYALDSVNILRKYVKFVDRLFNNTSDLECTISTPEQHCVTVNDLLLCFKLISVV